MLAAMAKGGDGNGSKADQRSNQSLWLHLSSQLIFFVLHQLASFPFMIEALYARVRSCLNQQ